MLGLNTSQIICFAIGIFAAALAAWQAKATQLPPQKAVAAYLWFVMIADIVGVVIQHYVTTGMTTLSERWYIRAAQSADVILYLGWSFAFALLSVWVFGRKRERDWLGGGLVVAWMVLCKVALRLYPEHGASTEVIASHKELFDHLFTTAHVVSVGIGIAFTARYYITKNWPLLPHLTTTLLLAGAISDCAGEYAHAKPSVDYDLSSIAGIMVYSFVVIVHIYAALRRTVS